MKGIVKWANKCYRMPKGQSIMDNPEKMATYGTQCEEKHNTICVGHHYTQANISNVNKTWTLLQTTRGKVEPNQSTANHKNVLLPTILWCSIHIKRQ
jgi:hypothetical protein